MWIILLCLGVASAGRLDNTYLPPSNAQISGGNGDFLDVPIGNVNGEDLVSVPARSQQYGVPLNNRYLPPSSTIGRPNGNGNGHFLPGSNGGFNGGHSGSGLLNNRYLAPSSRRPVNGNGHHFAGSNGGLTGAHFPSSTFNGQSSYQAASSSVGPAPVYGPPGHYNGNGGSYGRADARANILRFNNANNGDGNYHFEYETENKISQQEVGQVKDVAPEGGVTVVQGTYSYVGDDGHSYTVNYVADENGFRPAGDHIHKDIQATAEEAARSAASEVGYPGSSNDQNGYRY